MGHSYDRQCRCDRCQNAEIWMTLETQSGPCAGRDFTSDTARPRKTRVMRPVPPTYLS